MSRKINLFISHYGGDEEYVEKFKKLISKNYEARDSSLVETEPNNAKNTEYIKSILRNQIDWAGKVVVLIGPETHERDWVDWEIEYAATHRDKRVVGVYLPGATESDLPKALEEYGDACVAWNNDKIKFALDGNNIWEDSSGTPRASADTRATC